MQTDLRSDSTEWIDLPNRHVSRGDLVRFAQFNLSHIPVRRFVGEPHFETDATEFFLEKIAACRSYLEFGAGGSTLKAASLGLPFVSVECDRLFASAMRKSLSGLRKDQRLLYINVGLTTNWSEPLLKTPTKGRVTKWKAYWERAWNFVSESAPPDLTLIDGRFRICCALETVKRLSGRQDWTILVHDYTGRPIYRAIEEFANLERTVDSMAVFRPKEFSLDDLQRCQVYFSTDWR